MTKVIELSPEQVIPPRNEVFALQGVPEGGEVSERIQALLDDALEDFLELVEPIGLIQDIEKNEFSEVYEGEGNNDKPAPLERIFRRADCLALFANTLGEPVCNRIKLLFDQKDYARACMLDSVASVSADLSADILQRRFEKRLEDNCDGERGVLRYSPGYCGWHISGQRRLFEYLNPSRIGIELNSSCLMQPIKSVSGVIVAGAREIHIFPNAFPFCSHCTTQSCRSRIRSLLLQ